MITTFAVLYTLVGQATAPKPHPASRPLSRICVVSISEARADEIANLYLKAKPEERTPEHLNCRLLGGDGPIQVLADNEIFRQSVVEHHNRVLDLFKQAGTDRPLEWNKLDPASQESLRAVMFRLQFKPEHVVSHLQGPNPKIGAKAYCKVRATVGDKTIEMFLEPQAFGQAEKLVQDNWTREDREHLMNQPDVKDLATRTFERYNPGKLAFRFLETRVSLITHTDELAKITRLLSDAMKAEVGVAEKKRRELSDSWMRSLVGGSGWPPAEGSKFDALSPGVQNALESLIHARMPNFSFASKAEATEFLRNAKLQFGPTEMSIHIAENSKGGTIFAYSLTLAGLRF